MKTFLVLVLLLAAGCSGCATVQKMPDCWCDGPVINGVCDGVLICTHESGFCPLDGGGCRK